MASFLKFTFVLFGATGNLAGLRLIPALVQLFKTGNLHPDTRIIGVGRKAKTNEEFASELWAEMTRLGSNKGFTEAEWGLFCRQAIPSDDEEIPRLQYVACDVGEGDFSPLKTAIERTRRVTDGNILYYLSVDPSLFSRVIGRIHAARLSGRAIGSQATVRILVEKPHGRDEKEAADLMDLLDGAFHRRDQLLVDHKLAEDFFRELVSTRRGSALWGWNDQLRRLVGIRILAHETIGVEARSFLAKIGSLADMIAGHELGMLGRLVAASPRRKDVQIQPLSDFVLDRIESLPLSCAQRAWAEGVDPGAHRETFARVTFPYQVADEPWSRPVQVVLETGKCLGPDKVTAVQFLFHSPRVELTLGRPHDGPPLREMITYVLSHKPGNPDHIPFVGTIREYWQKKPGLEFGLKPRREAHRYCEGDEQQADAYAVVLRKAMLEEAEPEVFAGRRQTGHSWRILSQILDAWKTPPRDALFYPKGTNPSDPNGNLGSLLPADWPYPKYVIPLNVLQAGVQLVGP